ncbi:MAG: glycosyltransferase family 2 protein [Sulfitobacter sp.]
MKQSSSLIARIRKRLKKIGRRRSFNRAIERVHGADLQVPVGEVLAIVLVRDGSYYIDDFLAYYRALGVKYFAFVDNGSSDGTLDRLKSEVGCVVDRAVLPLGQYEDLLRAYPAETYGRDRWCLYVDMDEQFDFEGRETHGLSALIHYLEMRGETALMAQMLEMFPKTPLTEVRDFTFKQSLEAFDYYDISTVDCHGYHSAEIPFEGLLRGNQLTSTALQFKFGGVRGKVFGEACCLTKHPLIFNGAEVIPAPHPHLSQHVIVSDFTAVIRHYKFAGNIVARDAASAGSGDLAHGEDAARLEVLNAQQSLTLYSEDAQPWRGVEALCEDGFLTCSDAYRAYLKDQPK